MEDEKACNPKENPQAIEFKHIIILFLLSIGMTAMGAWLAPGYFGKDPGVFVRYIMLSLPAIVKTFLLVLTVCFVDYVTPQHGLDCMGRDARSNAIFFSAIAIAIAIILAFG